MAQQLTHARARTPAGSAPLPAWPVLSLLWGFPLWWVLGLVPFLPIVFSIVLAAVLLPRRGLRLGWIPLAFLAFMLWAAVSVVMLDGTDRLIGFAYRYAAFVLEALVLVYVLNARESLPMARVTGAMTAFWAFVVITGAIGVLAPNFHFTTPTAMVLPRSIASNALVSDWMNPSLAEVQKPWGAPEAFVRPSGPFPYTNTWGNTIALFTPAALAHFCLDRRRWVRTVILAVTALMALPISYSLSRGMLIGLAAAVVYVALRSAGRGDGRLFGLLLGLGAVVAVGATASGLLTDIAQRLSYSDTTAGRGSLYTETIQRTLASPWLGYGAPRPSYFHEISVGTQGYAFTLMFSHGFVGLALFLVFLWGAVVVTFRVRDRASLWLQSVLIAGCVTMWFYGLDLMQTMPLMLAAGVLIRDRRPALETG